MQVADIILRRNPLGIKIAAIFFISWGLFDILLSELIPSILNLTINILFISFILLGFVLTFIKFFIGVGIWKMKQWAWKLGLFILIYSIVGIIFLSVRDIFSLYDSFYNKKIDEILSMVMIRFFFLIIELPFLIYFLRNKTLVYFDLGKLSRIKIAGKLTAISISLVIFILFLPRLIMYVA